MLLTAPGSSARTQAPGATADGAFSRSAAGPYAERGTLPPPTSENGASSVDGVSADGRFVVLESDAGNLVPGDTNRTSDVFVFARRTGKIARVSLGNGGVQGNGRSYPGAISANGRFVAFSSASTNLVHGDTTRF